MEDANADLGDYSRLSLEAAVKSHNLDLFKYCLQVMEVERCTDEAMDIELVEAYAQAIEDNQDEMLRELEAYGIEDCMVNQPRRLNERLLAAAGYSGQYDKLELVLGLLPPPPFNKRRSYHDAILKAAAKRDHLALTEQISDGVSRGTTGASRRGRFEALREAISYSSNKVLHYLIEDSSWSSEELVHLLANLVEAYQDEVLLEVLEHLRFKGQAWRLPREAMLQMAHRSEEEFASTARSLLAHARTEDLIWFKSKLEVYENFPLRELMEELLPTY